MRRDETADQTKMAGRIAALTKLAELAGKSWVTDGRL